MQNQGVVGVLLARKEGGLLPSKPATYGPVPQQGCSECLRGGSVVPPSVDAERNRFTVAGLIRRLSSLQPSLEMLVQGEERRTWAEEFAAACRVAQALLPQWR